MAEYHRTSARQPQSQLSGRKSGATVTDMQLYPYLVRLAVIAHKLTSEDQRRRKAANNLQIAAIKSETINKLPKGTLKALMAYFKLLALDQQGEPVDPSLKRTYLAFYAQLLDPKSDKVEALLKSPRAEPLIVEFVSAVTKIAGTGAISSQGSKFVQLLRSIAKNQGGNSQLDQQLAEKQNEIVSVVNEPQRPQTSDLVQASQIVDKQIAQIMLVSPILFEKDLARELSVSIDGTLTMINQRLQHLRSEHHPTYCPEDFESYELWQNWAEAEESALLLFRTQLQSLSTLPPTQVSESVPDLIPANNVGYFTLFLQRCIEYEKPNSCLFSEKTLETIKYVAKFWRIGSHGFARCLLSAINALFSQGACSVDSVGELYDFASEAVSKIPNAVWATSDSRAILLAMKTLVGLCIEKVHVTLGEILKPNPPKLGPYLYVIQELVPQFHQVCFSSLPDTMVTSEQLSKLKQALRSCGQKSYEASTSELPRDNSLAVSHILELVNSVIASAVKLRRKFKDPLLGQLHIAKLVSSEKFNLLNSDFLPLWKHCIQQYGARNEEPPFDDMVKLHNQLLLFKDLYSETSSSKWLVFEPEELLFPYFYKWAADSAILAKEWVRPALEQDNSTPMDESCGILHSSSVKDLFDSFHSFLKLVDSLHWQNENHLGQFLTVVIKGISDAVSEWALHVKSSYVQTVKPGNNPQKMERDQWLAYAKEKTAKAKAAVLAARQGPQIEDFEFKRECGVQVNSINAAYEMLIEMEANLNSDKIARDTQKQSKGSRSAKQLTHLFTLTVLSVADVNKSDSDGLYVTLVDQDTRKQLGKTHTAYGNSLRTTWDEVFEIEVGAKPRLLKATVWWENENSNHDLCGRAMIQLDAKSFASKEYGMQLNWLDLESGAGKLQVMIAVDALRDDIRFHFGRSLRYLMRVKETMVNSVVQKFSGFIYAIISKRTLSQLSGSGSLHTSVQTGVNQLQKSFNMWLGKSLNAPHGQTIDQEKIEDSLDPLYDYLNKNFATIAEILAPDLRIEILSKTWDVILDALELLIIPPLHSKRLKQRQLTSTEMEIVYSWLSCLRDFFHSDGVGPSLERLQNHSYQQIMAIPVYYDLPTTQLKMECEKLVKGNLPAVVNKNELLARQHTVMAHRNKSVIEHQSLQLSKAQSTVPQLDDVILRILRLRREDSFIEVHMRYRERLIQREMTERALHG